MKKSIFKAVIFDMDGTLTVPTIDFEKMRKEIGCEHEDIIDGINSLEPEERERAWRIVEQHEREAMKKLRLNEGVCELLKKLEMGNIRKGVLTRNSKASYDEFVKVTNFTFDIALDRSFPFLKPHPAAVIHMLTQWGISPSDSLVVGDYIHDIQCGLAAGAFTCLVLNERNQSYSKLANFAVSNFFELENIIFA